VPLSSQWTGAYGATLYVAGTVPKKKGGKTPRPPRTTKLGHVPAKMSKAAIERQRALLSRERYLAEKLRIESRRERALSTDPAVIERRMVRALERFRETHKKSDYSKFRKAKRMLYIVAPLQAPGIVQDAAVESGWEEAQSAKFARLS
jgi:hypothetical protein